MSKNYYKILGVSRDASEKEIRKAYKDLALKFHPDKNKAKDAEDKFKLISEAYHVLSNADKRAAYDRYGEAGAAGLSGRAGGAGGHSQAHEFQHFHTIDPFEMFRAFFGGVDPFNVHLQPSHLNSRHRFQTSPADPLNAFFRASFFDDFNGMASPGAGASSTTTTTYTTNGGTIHITKTVVGQDGSIRRETRFQAPSSRPTSSPIPDSSSTNRAKTSSSSHRHSGPAESSRDPPPPTMTPRMPERDQPDGAAAPATPSSSSSAQPKQTSSISQKKCASSSVPGYASPTISSSLRKNDDPSSSSTGASAAAARKDRSPMSRGRKPRTAGAGLRPRTQGCTAAQSPSASQTLIQCPLCGRQFSRNVIEVHASTCQGRTSPPDQEHDDWVLIQSVQDAAKLQPDAVVHDTNPVQCPICSQFYPKSVIEDHAANCGEEVYV